MTENASDIFVGYQNILGHAKMQELWRLFEDEASKCLESIESTDAEIQRLHFHSLRSAALVFGMRKFSDCCALIEEMFINGAEKTELAKEIEKAKLIFNRERQIVGAHL